MAHIGAPDIRSHRLPTGYYTAVGPRRRRCQSIRAHPARSLQCASPPASFSKVTASSPALIALRGRPDLSAYRARPRERLGQPVVPNGLPLSKIHHAAFDAHLIGIDPDYRLHVSERLLGQHDGPMLKALTRLNSGTIHLIDARRRLYSLVTLPP